MQRYKKLLTMSTAASRRAFSEKKQKGGMPEFLNYYGKLFEQSKVMERIMPRSVTHKELKEHFPYLFTEYNH